MLGVRVLLGSSRFVTGDVLCSLSHFSISVRSYVCPSEVMTGSFISSLQMGHVNARGTSRSTDPRRLARRLALGRSSSESSLSDIVVGWGAGGPLGGG